MDAELKSLAMSLWRICYQDASPEFELCDSTAEVITQIDNMVAGIIEKNQLLQAELDLMKLNWSESEKTIAKLIVDVEYWKGRAETGANATHWPEFGPSGGKRR